LLFIAVLPAKFGQDVRLFQLIYFPEKASSIKLEHVNRKLLYIYSLYLSLV